MVMFTSLASASLLAASTLLTFASAVPVAQPVPSELQPDVQTTGPNYPCSWNNPPPCKCTAGTYLNQSSTTAVIGAPVHDVYDIMHSFFNTAWYPGGLMPTHTSGKDNTPSARRTFPFTVPDNSKVDIIEGLNKYTEDGHGGFTMEIDIANVPVKYNGGAFTGDWDTLTIKSVGSTQTRVDWGIYTCFTGYSSKFDHSSVSLG